MSVDVGWMAVRTVIGTPWQEDGTRAYEERITVWQVDTFEEAIGRARDEANSYAKQWDPAADVLDLQQVVRIFDQPADGTEVFSLVRDSALRPAEYLNRYFDSGQERIQSAE